MLQISIIWPYDLISFSFRLSTKESSSYVTSAIILPTQMIFSGIINDDQLLVYQLHDIYLFGSFNTREKSLG